MKKSQKIIAILFIALGFCLSVVLFCISKTTQLAIKEPVDEKHYNFLKEEALNLAKTLDKEALSDDTLIADIALSEEELVVKVESIKARVTAKIPISDYSLSIENGVINSTGIAEFENVEFEEYDKLMPAWWYILLIIAAGLFVATLPCTLLVNIFSSTDSENEK